MPRSYLACTVRGCGLPLNRRERVFVCATGHTFDVARSGYLNLLQPQDRRSLTAGDPRAVVEARARLMAAGVGGGLLDDIAHRTGRLDVDPNAAVVDLGCGSGDVLGAVARERAATAVGIDISAAAAEHAARRFPGVTWVVANADRDLPLLDRSASIVLTVNARRNPAECARVLGRGGFLLVAIPAPDDLIELRTIIGGERVERQRADAVAAEHAAFFNEVDRAVVRAKQPLEPEALRDLLRVTYRGERHSAGARVSTLQPMEVTLASEVLVFEWRRSGRDGSSS